MASDRADACPHCGAALPKYGDTCLECDRDISDAIETVPDHYAHITGNVFWDRRSRYTLVELPGIVLVLLPASVLHDWFPWAGELLYGANPEIALWLFHNSQSVGVVVFVASLAARITLDDRQRVSV